MIFIIMDFRTIVFIFIVFSNLLFRNVVEIKIKMKTIKKRTRKIVDLAVPADHRIKLKKCEKKGNFLKNYGT